MSEDAEDFSYKYNQIIDRRTDHSRQPPICVSGVGGKPGPQGGLGTVDTPWWEFAQSIGEDTFLFLLTSYLIGSPVA
jgi:hypothetical protein